MVSCRCKPSSRSPTSARTARTTLADLRRVARSRPCRPARHVARPPRPARPPPRPPARSGTTPSIEQPNAVLQRALDLERGAARRAPRRRCGRPRRPLRRCVRLVLARLCPSLTLTGTMIRRAPASAASCAPLRFGASATITQGRSRTARTTSPVSAICGISLRRHEAADLDLRHAGGGDRLDPADLDRRSACASWPSAARRAARPRRPSRARPCWPSLDRPGCVRRCPACKPCARRVASPCRLLLQPIPTVYGRSKPCKVTSMRRAFLAGLLAVAAARPRRRRRSRARPGRRRSASAPVQARAGDRDQRVRRPHPGGQPGRPGRPRDRLPREAAVHRGRRGARPATCCIGWSAAPFEAQVAAQAADGGAGRCACCRTTTSTLNRAAGAAEHAGRAAQPRRRRAVARSAARQAQLAAAQAQLRQAQINLDYTEIKAPIDGKISRTTVTEGNVVSPSSGMLATIVSQDPMYVLFPVSVARGARPARPLRRQGRLQRGEDQAAAAERQAVRPGRARSTTSTPRRDQHRHADAARLASPTRSAPAPRPASPARAS